MWGHVTVTGAGRTRRRNVSLFGLLGCWRLSTRGLSYGSLLVLWLLLLLLAIKPPSPATASGAGNTFGPDLLQLLLRLNVLLKPKGP